MMPEILIHQDLPHIKFRGNSASLNCNICAVTRQKNEKYYILADGSHSAMYKMSKLSMPEISHLFTLAKNRFSIQIYKLKNGNNCEFYACFKKTLDYSVLKISWQTFFTRFRSGGLSIIDRLRTASLEVVSEFDSYQNKMSIKPCDPYKNSAVEYIYDFGFALKSNLGIVKTGDEIYISSFSINNIATLASVRNIMRDYDYLQIISLIRPSKEREQKLRVDMLEKTNIISALSSKKDKIQETRVHTIVDSSEYTNSLSDGIFYCNCKFIFRASSLDDLNQTIHAVEKKLLESKIAVYRHTVSGLSEFLSVLPGNANYGEHYYTVFQSFAPQLFFKLISL